ncbi:hypothetical protein NYO98_06680 [Nocardioides sp. STR2]|uniref:Uncharacterized protein n=1 Tax=Nocardioides pini TaxID=2975053 RepID=A0ABT4CAG6_9ACTN|nr:hypothetical protein [Nocardioides pini]MCY4725957.1 hypothetical protein [Nocardioides pini]
MTTSHGGDQGSQGSSRYGPSPVGGLGEALRTRPQQYQPAPPTPEPSPAPEYGEHPPPPEPGYQPEQPPEPAYQPDQPPPPTGYGSEPEPGENGGYAPETPEPEEPETPEGGYGPEDPQYGGGGETPEPPEQPPTGHPCPPSMTCDTRGIDDLQCEASGVKAESDALAAVAEALAKRRTDFETARSAYTQSRDAASQAVKDLNRRVDDLLDDTRCLLNKDDVACIDEAFGQVLDCLEDCDDEAGCCIDEGCGFEGETWSVGQIEDLRAQVVKVEKCFDEVLVKEPANLTDRVTKVTGLVDKLAEDLKADPREDANRLYARAKHARWVLDAIWGRFADVNEFQNCLCCGLTCSLRGRQWLALLEGKKAYQECQEKSRLRRCTWLRENVVDETLATQILLCPPRDPCAAESSD